MKRSEGERIRLTHSLTQLTAIVESIRLNISLEGHRLQTAEALVSIAFEITTQLARLDAYERSELDSKSDLE